MSLCLSFPRLRKGTNRYMTLCARRRFLSSNALQNRTQNDSQKCSYSEGNVPRARWGVRGLSSFCSVSGTQEDQFSSVQFSHSVVSDSLRPHGLQYARPPCPSPTPGVYSNSCPLSQWCHPTISSSVVPFSSVGKAGLKNLARIMGICPFWDEKVIQPWWLW